MGRKHVHQTAQFGKLEIIASCMIFQIDPIRQFCTKHVPMTQYAIIISTSTTPSCGGPLRAQIFRKVCFYEQKYDFWHVRVPFALFTPPKLIKKQKFSQMIFFAVFLCHIEPTCQKLCFYNKNCKFWPLGPLLPYLKGPPNSSKTEIFKNYNVFCLNLSH